MVPKFLSMRCQNMSNKIQNTLQVIGSLPGTLQLGKFMSVFNSTLIGSRDAFDPSGILSTIEHGDQVLVLDSKKLPSDWYQDVLTDFLPEDHHHPMKVPENQSPLSFPENFSLSQDSIPRVLVFTTMLCLSLIS